MPHKVSIENDDLLEVLIDTFNTIHKSLNVNVSQKELNNMVKDHIPTFIANLRKVRLKGNIRPKLLYVNEYKSIGINQIDIKYLSAKWRSPYKITKFKDDDCYSLILGKFIKTAISVEQGDELIKKLKLTKHDITTNINIYT